MEPFLHSNKWLGIEEHLNSEKNRSAEIYPAAEDIFRAFNLLEPEQVKVIIIGQDPYHGPDQADGLAFSVSKTPKLPPSLKNIFKAIAQTTGSPSQCMNGDLSPWSKQGVLLLNATLTVEKGKANSHQSYGWQGFTDYVIEKMGTSSTPKVFLLWGSFAHKKKGLIQNPEHKIFMTPHPSPLSAYRGFFEHPQFLETNQFLQEQGQKPIIW